LYKIAVLVSGSGSNLQAIIDSINKGELNCTIGAVISDKEDAYGIERAKSNNIATYVFSKKQYGDKLSAEILKVVEGKVDLIVLAGFLSILKGDILNIFKNKIINIHPSLLPLFCGSNMYGIKVHEKVIESGAKVSGCTVHYVEAGIDTGNIILQKTVPVCGDDTPLILQKRVLEQEHKALPEVIRMKINESEASIK
jgi:phosphoribosylglycinamide formyltransferase-1